MRPKVDAALMVTLILVLWTIDLCSVVETAPVPKNPKGILGIFRNFWRDSKNQNKLGGVEQPRPREEGNPSYQEHVKALVSRKPIADSQKEHVPTREEKCIISADKEGIEKLEAHLNARVDVKCHAKGEELAELTDFELEGGTLKAHSQSTVHKVKKKGSVDDGVRYARKHYKLCPPRQVKKCITHKQFVEEVIVGAMMFDNNLFVNPLHVFIEGDQYYLFTEWINGGDLFSLIYTVGIFHVADIRPYAKLLAEALAALHSQGVIHRDVKMDNVLLGGPRGLKLGDFGSSTRAKHERGLIGTRNYWAPEMFRGETHTKKLDAWSYGVVLLEMAIGRNMFREQKMDNGTRYLPARDSDEVEIPTHVNFPTDYPLLFEQMALALEIEFDQDFRSMERRLLVWDPEDRRSIESVLKYSSWLIRQQVDYEQLPFKPGTREDLESGKIESGYYYRGKHGTNAELKKTGGFIKKPEK